MKLDFTDEEFADLAGALTWSSLVNEEMAKEAQSVGLPSIAKQYRDNAEQATALQEAISRKIFFSASMASTSSDAAPKLAQAAE